LKQRSDSGEVAEGEAQRSLRRASKNSDFRSTRECSKKYVSRLVVTVARSLQASRLCHYRELLALKRPKLQGTTSNSERDRKKREMALSFE
jgi:hypothetical protein